jgi:hypothetical protein
MKNKFALVVVCLSLLTAVLGCSSINPLAAETNSTSNKTITDQGVDTVVGESTIGVAECDEVMDMLTAELNNPEDSFVTKAGKGFVLNKIKDSIKQSVVDNQNDKTKLAKDCSDFKKQLVKYKAEEEKKKAAAQ